MDLIFRKGTELVAIRIIGSTLYFSQIMGGHVKYAGIEGLRLSPSGIIKEFPDLKGKPIAAMRKEALKRLKKHIKKMNSEDEIKDYLKTDLAKYGYKLTIIQKKGFRPIKVKEDG